MKKKMHRSLVCKISFVQVSVSFATKESERCARKMRVPMMKGVWKREAAASITISNEAIIVCTNNLETRFAPKYREMEWTSKLIIRL
jgi:hypothetical protein